MAVDLVQGHAPAVPQSVLDEHALKPPPHLRLLTIDAELRAAAAAGDICNVTLNLTRYGHCSSVSGSHGYPDFMSRGTAGVADWNSRSRLKSCYQHLQFFAFDLPSIERQDYVSHVYSR